MWAVSQPASVPLLNFLSRSVLHHCIAEQPNYKQAVRAGIISSGSKYSLGSPLDGLAFLGKPHLDCIFRKPACCVQRETSRWTSPHFQDIPGRRKWTNLSFLYICATAVRGRDGGLCVSCPGLHGAFLPPCCVWLYFCTGFSWQSLGSGSGALQGLVL